MMRGYSHLLALFILVGFMSLGSKAALADCTSPAGVESQTIYDFTGHALKVCTGTSWVNLSGGSGGGSGNTMVSGWPDAVRCVRTSDSAGVIMYANFVPLSALSRYRAIVNSGGDYVLDFNSNGTWNTTTLGASNCDNKTIAQLYTDGQAFNLVGGATASAAGSVGQVQFYEGGNLAADAGLTWDNTNKRLGIGTAAPSSALDISSGTVSLLVGADNTAVTRTNATQKAGRIAFPHYLSAQVPALAVMGVSDSTDNSISIGGGSGLANAATTLSFYTAVNNTTPTGTRRMFIDASGNVGIGTTSSSAPLHVEKNQAAETTLFVNNTNASGYSALRLGPSDRSTNGDGMVFAGTTTGVRAGNRPLVFQTGSADTERMRIDASGNVGIGTSSPANYKLVIDATMQNSAKIGILTTGRSGGEYPSVGYNVRYGGTSSAYTYDVTDTASMIRFQSGKVETFTAASGTTGNAISFTTGPYVAQGGTTWSAGSDVRLKKNIQPITVLDKLDDFRAVSFDWKETGKHDLGVIAQEMYKVFPDVVDKGDNDLDAEITSASKGKWGVQYDKLGALALQAAKELKAETDNLRAQLKAANDNQSEQIEALREEIRSLKAGN